MSECNIDTYSSRMCEKGTKGCDVNHSMVDKSKYNKHDFMWWAWLYIMGVGTGFLLCILVML